ncbi:MAG: site-2 protease family protein, partial [Myxococcota bacterium]|nr:site-2 protease family protein [Myxococcota bacterium]
FRQASKAAEEGLFRWFRMMAMLSISLGIVNLLPIPVLDGGQILFYSIEGIRGRPLSLRVRELAQQAGVLFLVFLMLLVMVFDISRLFGAG